MKIIYSNVFAEQFEDFNFRSWHYAIIKDLVQVINDDDFLTSAITNMKKNDFIFDSNCIMSAVDRKFLFIRILNMIILIKRTPQSIKIREIDEFLILFFEYVILKFILRNILDEKLVIDKLRRQIHIIDDLKTNMLIDSNILSSEKMLIDYNKKILVLNYCRGMKIFMQMKFFREKINKMIRVYDVITILAHFSALIFIKLRSKAFFEDKNFMFISSKTNRFDLDDEILFHIIDAHLCAVQINNITNRVVIIVKNIRLNVIQKFEEEKCYAMFSNYGHLTAESKLRKFELKSWLKKIFNLNINVLTISVTFINFNVIETFFNATEMSILTVRTKILFMKISISIKETSISIFVAFMKCITFMKIIIYDIESIRKQLIAITKRYLLLWQNIKKTVDIFKKKWMSIILKSNVKIDAAKVYFLKFVDRKFLDKKFNKLHDQNRMKYTLQSISFDWSIFVM